MIKRKFVFILSLQALFLVFLLNLPEIGVNLQEYFAAKQSSNEAIAISMYNSALNINFYELFSDTLFVFGIAGILLSVIPKDKKR